MIATLVIGEWDWVWPTVAIAVMVVGLLGWAYGRIGVAGRVRAACLGLKLLAFLLIASSLFEPLWSGTRATPGANLFLVLADNSRSLSVTDDDASRGEQLKQLISDSKADWATRLEQDFDVRKYLFDARLRSTGDFSELDFAGSSSSLQTTLDALRKRYRSRPVAGVLLLTDGNATDALNRELDLEGLPPIYPVIFGADSEVADLAIDRVHVSQTSFEDAPVTVRADIEAVGFDDREIVGRLLDSDGKVVQSSKQIVVKDKPNSFRFQFRPDSLGLSFYRVEVAAVDEDSDEKTDEVKTSKSDEATKTASREDKSTSQGKSSKAGKKAKPKHKEVTLANNSRLIKVDRGGTDHRVLYVSGRPNWEYKFLRRAITDDEHIDLVAMIRIADKEPKFNFLGRVGESANPLFRGMDKKGGDEVERFDEAVIMRLNTKDSDELRKFPKNEEELYQFDAVIIDDVESEFFSPDQHELLDRYVSERGGALMMLGGAVLLGFPSGFKHWRRPGVEPANYPPRKPFSPGFSAQLAALSVNAGLKAVPQFIWLKGPPNAYLAGSRQNPTIVLAESLHDLLSERLLLAVIAHELAHAKGGDRWLLRTGERWARFCYAGSAAVLLIAALYFVAQGVLLAPTWTYWVLAFAPALLSGLHLAATRQREFAADAEAARLTGDPSALAQALARIQFATAGPALKATLEEFTGLKGRGWWRTHPPIEQRIARLTSTPSYTCDQ